MDSDNEDPYEDISDLDEYDLDDEDINMFSQSVTSQQVELPKGSCCLICDKYLQGLSIIKDDPMSYHKRSIKCLNASIVQANAECQINSVRNSTITSLYIKVNELLNLSNSTHFADLFLRVRHEILFIRLCYVLGFKEAKSDMKFSDILPISSNRTPDWIKIDQKDVTIIEVTVTTNFDKAAKSKGVESMGYHSKYRREIDELKKLGFNVSYYVIVFDAIDITDTSYKLDIKELCYKFGVEFNIVEASYLESVRKEFCKLSRIFYTHFGDCLSKLFNKPLVIKNDKSDKVLNILDGERMEDLGQYKLINISPVLFDTIMRNWNRLIRVLESYYDDEDLERHSIPIYDHATSKFRFKFSEPGLDYNDWISCLINDNKALFCRYLKMYYKSEAVEDRKSGFEFFYYEKINNTDLKTERLLRESSDPIVYNHQNSFVILDTDDVDCTETDEKSGSYNELCSKYEDPDYEEKLLNNFSSLYSVWVDESSLKKWSLKTGVDLLANKMLNKNMVANALKTFNEKMIIINKASEGCSITLSYSKSPTIYPINITYPDSYGSIYTKPIILDDLLKYKNLGVYTNQLLMIASRSSFEWGSRPKQQDPELLDLQRQIKELQGQSLAMQKEQSKNKHKIVKLKEIEGGTEISKELSILYAKLRKLKLDKGGDKAISAIRLRTSKNSLNTNAFKDEMAHFKDKSQRSAYKGVGLDLDFTNIKTSFRNLSNYLLSPASTKCFDEIYHDEVGDDIPLLNNLKRDYLNAYQSYYNWLKSTNLYHCCAFISRLCHTLLFYSQSSLSSSYVAIDNLGYTDCILICKGGKKIFPTKRSKLFRIIYPAPEPYVDLSFPHGFETSNTLLKLEGRSYIVSPWQLWHETHLTDGLTFLSRCMGFCLLSRIPERDHFKNAESCLFNIMLSFHARRQTESMLHNLRYIMVNCLGDLTAIDDMLPEFAGFNYDSMQFYLRNCISENFLSYFESSQKLIKQVLKEGWDNAIYNTGLPHLFMNFDIRNSDDFARSIYSTYLMPKAPITQSLEQVSNLKSMLETHKIFLQESDNDVLNRRGKNYHTLNDATGIDDYCKKMFSSDFNFDPSYMILLGKMMSDYLSNKFTKSEMSITWDNILSRNWDKMANSSGLRGNDFDFFGKKGYYVVYDDILNTDKLDKLLTELANTDIDEKNIMKLNETYSSKIKDESLEQIIFHVVDKVQRGGKREIFVMDKMTKVHQQPIESFMAEISKKCPSEMISIPSNKRLHTIHSRVFESKHETSNQSYYWVLDCRKWAPRSMLEKFIYFLSGMRKVLPPTFLKHCYSFFTMMLEKQVHTRPHIVEIISKSESNKWIDFNWLMRDENKQSCYYNMSYSWMMGIFNYFSSLIHVANQLHASHMIQSLSMRCFRDFTTLTPIAHSDDSAAKLSSPSSICTQRCIALYEILLKCSNHMLSKKKCNIGRVYFEFISILYLGAQLLPLLPKFLGQFNFQPTDGGYCTDINDSYSKCINLIQNGATFQQAYVSMKIQSMLIWRFYFGQGRVMNYNLPTQLYGSMDAHPIMVLLSGSDADIIRLYKIKGEKYLNKLSFINNFLNPNKEIGLSLFNPINATPDIRPNSTIRRHIDKIPENYRSEADWTLTNVDFKNTAFNALQYLLKLKNKRFCAALQDDTLSRRISRSYYFRESTTINTNVGMLKQSELITLITAACSAGEDFEILGALGIPDPESLSVDLQREFKSETKFSKVINLIYSELMRLLDYWSKMSYNEKNIYHQKKTTKPIHVNLQKTIESLNVKFEPSYLTSWIKEPRYRNLLPNSVGFKYAHSEFEEVLDEFGLNCEDVSASTVYHILSKLKSKTVSNIYCYGNVPSGLREINTYQDITLYLSHNSFDSKYIKGLTLPLGRTINIAAQNIMPELRDEDVQHTCSILNIIISCKCTLSKEAFSDFCNLDVKLADYLQSDQDYAKVGELPNIFLSYWNKNKKISCYFNSMIKIAKNAVNFTEIKPELLHDAYYHCFVKRQFLVVDVWMGKGRLFIGLGKEKVLLEIDGPKVTNIVTSSTSMELDKTQINYLNFVLHSCELNMINDHMIEMVSENLDRLKFGIGHDGTYKIGTGRTLIKHIPMLTVDPNMTTRLNNLDIFKVKLRRRMKLELESSDEIFGDNKFIINLFIVDPEKSLEIGRNMIIESINNEKILKKWNKDNDSYILDILSQSLDIDLYVHHGEIYHHYEYTKLFKILNYMQTNDKASIYNNKLRPNSYPAQEGGLLDVLIKYQIETGDLDFNWNRIISPELMHLKSTQPEAFMSNLIDNIEQKYNSLYDIDDKEQMFKEMNRIINCLGKDDSSKRLIDMLTMWGFVGVSGSISEMSTIQVKSNYNIFRDYPDNFPLIRDFSNCFKIFLKNLFETYITNFASFGENYKPLMNVSYYRYEHDKIKELIISLIMSINCNLYKGGKSRHLFITAADIIIYEMLLTICNNHELSSSFKAGLAHDYLLCQIPINSDNILELFRAYRALSHCYIATNKIDEQLDNNVKINRTNNTQLNIISKNFAKDMGIEFNVRRVHYNGLIPVKLYERLNRSYQKVINKVDVRIALRVLDFKQVDKVNFHPAFNFKGKLTDEFLESDEFEEINYELEMLEPDLDNINETLENYESEIYKEDKIMKIVINSKITEHYKVPVLNCIGLNNSTECYTKYLQSGNDVVIICTAIYTPLFFSSIKFKLFKFKYRDWHDKSLLNPEHIFAIVISKHIKQTNIWCEILDAELVENDWIPKINFNYKLSTGRSKDNNIIDDYETIYGDPTENDKILEKQLIWNNNDIIADKDEDGEYGDDGDAHADEETNKKGDAAVDEQMLNLLIEQGIERETAETLRERINTTSKQSRNISNIFEEVFSKILENKKTFDKILNMQQNIINAPLTEDQVLKIFQVPSIFGTKISRDSNIKNNALKDKELMAELDSLTGSLTNKLISGLLTITPKMYQRAKTCLSMCKKLVNITQKDKKRKTFLLDVFTLFINDAKVTTDSPYNDQWSDAISIINTYIDWDDDEVEGSLDIYGRVEEMQGRIGYRLYGERT